MNIFNTLAESQAPIDQLTSFGVAGVSRMWEQLDSMDGAGPELPMYGGRIRRRPGARRS